jgi:hypothetical protein
MIGTTPKHWKAVDKIGQSHVGIVCAAKADSLGRFQAWRLLPEIAFKDRLVLERFQGRSARCRCGFQAIQ